TKLQAKNIMLFASFSSKFNRFYRIVILLGYPGGRHPHLAQYSALDYNKVTSENPKSLRIFGGRHN
ncbi:MAG: hypothetical protein FWF77_01650, partial [Defluviitaleaceae bacterium]|nr:hypothetical protein [Defluviitaleaceae bacterium]